MRKKEGNGEKHLFPLKKGWISFMSQKTVRISNTMDELLKQIQRYYEKETGFPLSKAVVMNKIIIEHHEMLKGKVEKF